MTWSIALNSNENSLSLKVCYMVCITVRVFFFMHFCLRRFWSFRLTRAGLPANLFPNIKILSCIFHGEGLTTVQMEMNSASTIFLWLVSSFRQINAPVIYARVLMKKVRGIVQKAGCCRWPTMCTCTKHDTRRKKLRMCIYCLISSTAMPTKSNAQHQQYYHCVATSRRMDIRIIRTTKVCTCCEESSMHNITKFIGITVNTRLQYKVYFIGCYLARNLKSSHASA